MSGILRRKNTYDYRENMLQEQGNGKNMEYGRARQACEGQTAYSVPDPLRGGTDLYCIRMYHTPAENREDQGD